MQTIAGSDLRNDIAGILRRVESGEQFVVTANGKPVAKLIPMPPVADGRWLTKQELLSRLSTLRADPQLRNDLQRLAGETTDDLPST
jgi:prevent-host-death family protein